MRFFILFFFEILKIINFSKFFRFIVAKINKPSVTNVNACVLVLQHAGTFNSRCDAVGLFPISSAWRPLVACAAFDSHVVWHYLRWRHTSGGAVLRERSRRSARVSTRTRRVKWPRVAALIESAPLAAQWLPLPSSRADWIIRNSPRSPPPSSRGTHEYLWAQVCAS